MISVSKATSKESALNSYKEARERYLAEMTEKNWKALCDAKRVCRLLGAII